MALLVGRCDTSGTTLGNVSDWGYSAPFVASSNFYVEYMRVWLGQYAGAGGGPYNIGLAEFTQFASNPARGSLTWLADADGNPAVVQIADAALPGGAYDAVFAAPVNIVNTTKVVPVVEKLNPTAAFAQFQAIIGGTPSFSEQITAEGNVYNGAGGVGYWAGSASSRLEFDLYGQLGVYSPATTRPRLRGGQTIVGELRGGQRWI